MSDSKKVGIPIYLVSLEQDVARRERLKERFPETYSNFQHIKAVDGRILPAKEYFDKTQGFYKKYHRIMSPAELGCTLSHIKALETFLASVNEFGLILEDDIIGTDKDIYLINSLIASFDENMLLLCGGQIDLPEKRYRFGRVIESKLICLVHDFSLKFVYGTCCYLVTRKSAQEILNFHMNNYVALADKWDLFFTTSNTKVYYKNILQHPDDLADSHIEMDRTLNNKTLFKKIFSKDLPPKILQRLYWELHSIILKFFGYKKLD